MARILVIRFASLGDIAISIPPVLAFAQQYPNHELFYLSNKRFASLFETMPDNIHFIGADLKGEHSSVCGLYKLAKEVRNLDIEYVADFHNVLKSQFICNILRLSGIKVASRKKDKVSRLKLLHRHGKAIYDLKSYHERYADVFSDLSLPIKLQEQKLNIPSPIIKFKNEKWIGIAPFSAHKGKIYPIEKIEEIVAYYSSKANTKVFLFGGGKYESSVFDKWIDTYKTPFSMVGKYALQEELGVMGNLDVMVSMDSANMHLAALMNTTVISIWGPSHPAVGFRPWKQDKDTFIQIDLPCRPCSEWGAKPCKSGDFACMQGIKVQTITNKIDSLVYGKN
ncbi:MAG: glycosyltransferase family 9 protein [Bacteroidia bacterium]|nr:glycosyltransferase family 9 protein [Bacteroidia bacterium]